MSRLIQIIFLLPILVNCVSAQEFEIDTEPKIFKRLNISGEYRGYFQQRNFFNPYILSSSTEDTTRLSKQSLLFGDATQLPELTLYVGATLSNNVAFGTDLTFWNLKQGSFDYFRGVHLGVNLYGTFNTDIGNFAIRTGGIQWLKLSRMTFKAFEGYNRYSLFTRNPWDPQSKNLVERYSQYFDRGAVSQDERWGNQAFHGFSIRGIALPNDLELLFLYGKAQSSVTPFEAIDNNYQQSEQFFNTQFYANLLPSYVMGGQLSFNQEKSRYAFNHFYGFTFSDTIGRETNNYYTNTFSYDIDFKNIVLIGELGVSKYNDLDIGESVAFKLKTDKQLTFYHLTSNILELAQLFTTIILK